MNRGFAVNASAVIDAAISLVWNALTKHEFIKHYMFGTNVVTDRQVGSPVVWKGEWQGKSYEDKGTILRFEEERAFSYSHFIPLSGHRLLLHCFAGCTFAAVVHALLDRTPRS